MIGNTIKGTDVDGVLRYLLSREKRSSEKAHMIAGTVAGRTVKLITAEFEAIRRLKRDLKTYVYHQMLRPPSEEGVALTDAVWAEIAEAHARAMGYADGQWLAVRHHDHIHIVANRVLPNGSVVSDSNDWKRAEKSVRRIEKHFGLTKVEPSHLLEPGRAKEHERAPTQAEVALAEKGDVSVRQLIQDQLLAVLDRDQTLTEFADRLHERGVLVRPNLQSTGRLAGLSYVLATKPDLAFSGTSLGRRFTLAKLKAEGLSYDPMADREGIARCLQRCSALQESPEPQPATPEEPQQPLVDPKAARKHLDALGVPVVLGVRDRGGHVKELGLVDSKTIGAWRRRLRRRSALGEEVLVRPAEKSQLLLFPRCTEPVIKSLKMLGIEPCLAVQSVWNRQDLWVRAAGNERDLRDLQTGLREIGLAPRRPTEIVWGHLAGYRADPLSNGSSTARQFKNRIALVADTIVEVSFELVEKLRRIIERRKRQMAATGRPVQSQREPENKGRSR